MLKEGDIVIMSSLGCDFYSDTDSNSHNMEGTILEYTRGYDKDDYAIRVLWNTGRERRYFAEHLTFASDKDWVFCPTFQVFYNRTLKVSINVNGKIVKNRRSRKQKINRKFLRKLGESFKPVFTSIYLSSNTLVIDKEPFELCKKSE